MSCEGCAYAIKLGGEWYCDYLSMTGRRRPCPPGEGCTVRKEGDLTKKGSAFMKRREWSTEKARALYDQGLSDAEIAEKVGTTPSAVAFWRRGQSLPANLGRKPPPGKEPGAPVPPTASPPSRPLAVPSAKGPVELSVEMHGRAFALRAPDMEGAEQIYEFAGLLLKDMDQIARKLKEGMNDA